MVGVPGRSKACNTCLKRKIKVRTSPFSSRCHRSRSCKPSIGTDIPQCDLTKPFCNNCAKSNRICGGYTRKTAYVFSDNVVLGKAPPAKDDGTLTYQGRWKGTAKTTSAECLLEPEPVTVSSQPRPRWANDACYFDSGHAFDTSASLVPSILNMHSIPMMPSLWQQLNHIFLTTYMPRQGLGTSGKPLYITGNWLLQLQGRPSTLPALQTAIAAFASAQIGRDHNDLSVVAQSVELYLRSLEHLRTAIADPATRLSDDTLAACLALGVYELTENRLAKPSGRLVNHTPTESRSEASRQEEPNGASAYGKHMSGAMMLLKLRGPEANTTPLAHSLFLGLRRQIVVTTLIKHSDTFLSQPEWRELPWTFFPKNILDRCLDCILDLPPLQRQADEMLRQTDTSIISALCDALIEKCTSLLADLESWYVGFEENVGGPIYWPKFCSLTSRQDDPKLGKPFPVSYFCPTFSTAYLLMTYWSGIMVTHWLLFVVYKKLAHVAQESTLDAIARTAPGLRAQRDVHKDTWVAMTRNMCQLTEYFLDESMGKVSITIALGLLEGARAMFGDGTEGWTRERAWLAEMIELTAMKLNTGSMVIL